MGGKAPVSARPQRMVVGGGVFSEDGRGRAWTGPILSNLIITTGKKMLSTVIGELNNAKNLNKII
jgi:hypothetical protein